MKLRMKLRMIQEFLECLPLCLRVNSVLVMFIAITSLGIFCISVR